jgi:hypothetical protein
MVVIQDTADVVKQVYTAYMRQIWRINALSRKGARKLISQGRLNLGLRLSNRGSISGNSTSIITNIGAKELSYQVRSCRGLA